MPVRGIRRRYLHIVVNGSGQPTEPQIDEAIRRSLLDLFGLQGLSEVDPKLIEYRESEKGGILRCSHDGLRHMRAAIAYITTINTENVSINVVRVSGTIRRLRMKTIEISGDENV